MIGWVDSTGRENGITPVILVCDIRLFDICIQIFTHMNITFKYKYAVTEWHEIDFLDKEVYILCLTAVRQTEE